jgi:hypothetical protein
MRKAGSILLLCIFLFNLIGYYPIFLIRQKGIIKRISVLSAQDSEARNLVVFRFNKYELASLKWLKKNEFSFKGGMYDVVKREMNIDGSEDLFCFFDRDEVNLLAGLKVHVDRNAENNAADQNKKQAEIKPILKDYCGAENQFYYLTLELSISYIVTDQQLISFIPEILSPPPKLS